MRSATAPPPPRSTWGLDHDDDWRRRARCHPSTAEWFVYTGRGLTEINLEALRLCRTCPVRTQCGDDVTGLPDNLRAGLIVAGIVYDADGRQTRPDVNIASATRREQWRAAKERARTPTTVRGDADDPR